MELGCLLECANLYCSSIFTAFVTLIYPEVCAIQYQLTHYSLYVCILILEFITNLKHNSLCKEQELSSQFGVIHSIDTRLSIECNWIIRASPGKRLIVRLIDLSIGRSGK